MSKTAQSRDATSVEVALAALDQLGGTTRYVDIEELTLAAFEAAPQLFRWRTRRDYPSPEKVRMALVHANEGAQKQGSQPLVISNKVGLAWRLTSAGVAFVATKAAPATGARRRTRNPASPTARRVRDLRRHDLFARWQQSRDIGDAPRHELADLLLSPPDSPAGTIFRKLDVARVAAADIDDSEVTEFLDAVANEVTHKWS